MSEIWQLGAVDLAAEISDRRVSAVEAVEAAIGRYHALNPGLNAITYDLSERALSKARTADKALAGGAPIGPLHGVPITIKENIDQKGLPTPHGVRAFADVIAPANSPLVDHLERAGAIIVGRTNTPEFSLRWFTDNPLRGLTTNPWDADVTPGGSSGGAAVAVAAGMCAMGHGNDLGGSLRYPAYACGCSTIRPSLGRVAAFNPSAGQERPSTFQLMSVQGPICREAKDTRLCLEIMAARDVRDPLWKNTPITGEPLAGPIRVALTRGPAGTSLADPVEAALMDAAAKLRDAGYDVVDKDPPDMAGVAALWRDLIATDTAMLMADTIRGHGSADINFVFDALCDNATLLDQKRFLLAFADQMRHLRDWHLFLEDYPLILAPVSASAPFEQGADTHSTARAAEVIRDQAMLYLVNLLGLPSAAQPTGLHEGVPIGVQIIGRPMREDLCLDAAEAIEARTGILAKDLWNRE